MASIARTRCRFGRPNQPCWFQGPAPRFGPGLSPLEPEPACSPKRCHRDAQAKPSTASRHRGGRKRIEVVGHVRLAERGKLRLETWRRAGRRGTSGEPCARTPSLAGVHGCRPSLAVGQTSVDGLRRLLHRGIRRRRFGRALERSAVHKHDGRCAQPDQRKTTVCPPSHIPRLACAADAVKTRGSPRTLRAEYWRCGGSRRSRRRKGCSAAWPPPRVRVLGWASNLANVFEAELKNKAERGAGLARPRRSLAPPPAARAPPRSTIATVRSSPAGIPARTQTMRTPTTLMPEHSARTR
jgi:hypothetical protein